MRNNLEGDELDPAETENIARPYVTTWTKSQIKLLGMAYCNIESKLTLCGLQQDKVSIPSHRT